MNRITSWALRMLTKSMMNRIDPAAGWTPLPAAAATATCTATQLANLSTRFPAEYRVFRAYGYHGAWPERCPAGAVAHLVR